MKIMIRLLAAAACLGTVQMVSAGDITGKITLKGKPPQGPEMPLKNDPFCGKLVSGNERMPWYVVDKDGGLADVFVYIKEGLAGKTFEPSAQPAVLDQVNCQYTPYVIGLQTKQKLMVKTSDPLLHNVHVKPTAEGNKESNMAMAPKQKPLEFAFNAPEVFLKVQCDVHPWMFAYVGLVDHPYFAISAKDGTFKIANVPPGEYVVEIVHRKTHPGGKGVNQKVKVGADGGKANFTIELPAQ